MIFPFLSNKCSVGEHKRLPFMKIWIRFYQFQNIHPSSILQILLFCLFSVKEYCDFEGDALCGWYLSVPATPVPPHSFCWQTGQGESIHNGEQNHRPANDHTLWAINSIICWNVFVFSFINAWADLLICRCVFSALLCILICIRVHFAVALRRVGIYLRTAPMEDMVIPLISSLLPLK